ncbi:hypothetical protein EJC49_23435 [Aquibium carbonis]|uniref:Uncharacterized protein n=1 Tax=Aquibium carbonis TaxID=2495581 RepID=A0A429YLY3_9HYPH|nr:hypothetical protein [Aquibium carbonis]RST82447.1 hypothetical protein EJC49_23435 [Aquibium carbonis]
MKALFVTTSSAVALLATLSAGGTAEPADRSALQSLRGTYVSPAVEPWYGGFGTREFVFRDGRWSLIFTHALDPQMTMRTFQFRTGGAFTVGEPSADVPGAFRTVFGEEWKHVTLLTDVPEIVAGMAMAACGLTLNLETDISGSGCAAWKPVADCGEDHDILALSAEGLHFGVRPADNDMCSADRTPTALLPAVVAR